MTDHLPECPYQPEIFSRGQFGNPCICQELRACEQRVNGHRLSYENGVEVGYDKGYVAGLSAARDAVAALPQHWPNSPALHRGTALAAIDALRLDIADCLCPTPNPDCQHPTCPRLENQ